MNEKKLTAEQSQTLIRHALTMAQKVCHERFCDAHPMGQAEVCKTTSEAITLLDHHATTVRQEVRAAAFREAIEIASRHREHSGYTLHQFGSEALDCRNVIWRELEAAANSVPNSEGEGVGRRWNENLKR